MPTLGWGNYEPDVTGDLDGQNTRALSSVIPRSDGYGPFNSLATFTSALPARCRGLFFARKRDKSIVIFAGTSTKLYMLNATTFAWTDVSVGGGSYTTLNSTDHWQFAQFNDIVIAVQANAAPQSFNLTSSSAFAALGGSPPQAAYIAIVNRFVVLSGLTNEPYRVHWSGLNSTTSWTAGVGSSDFQDLPDGGVVGQVMGGEFGMILQESAIRRMIFAPGSDTIFNIDRIAQDKGVRAHYSVAKAGERIFFLSPQGFVQTDQSGVLRPIGEEKVNRTFLAEYDTARPELMLGVADPSSHIILWVYKTAASGTTEVFDKGLVYNWALDRWAPVTLSGEFIAPLARPGLTLEGLDTIGSNAVLGTGAGAAGVVRLTLGSTSAYTTGQIKVVAAVGGTTEANGTWTITVIDATHIDLAGTTFANAWTSGGYVAGSLDSLPFSLDEVSTVTLPNLSMVNSSHMVGFFTGTPLEATLETPEQSGDGQRILVNGFYPLTDAATVHGRISKRENLNEAITYTDEVTMNSRGFVPQLRSTRYSRGKIRIPAGTSWTYAKGIRPDVSADGEI